MSSHPRLSASLGPDQRATIRVATFNINGVNRRLPNLVAWLNATAPDIACLQELKVTDTAFPTSALEAAGYGAVWCGEPTWNGVAILCRGGHPVLTRASLPGDTSDRQARYIEAAVRGILIGCLYLPNGNPQPGPKFAYKLAWSERLIAHSAALIEAGVPAVLAGDYNVAPTDDDIYSTKSYAKNALIQPGPRTAFRRLLEQGWTDTLRARHPDARIYTFWDYRRERWQRDAGLRLDHLLTSPALTPRVIDAGVDRNVRGEPDASDHAPTWIDLSATDLATKAASGRRTNLKPGHSPRTSDGRRECSANRQGRDPITLDTVLAAQPAQAWQTGDGANIIANQGRRVDAG